MKDYSSRILEEDRPSISTREAVDFCLKKLYADRSHTLGQEIVRHLTFEELIGAFAEAAAYFAQRLSLIKGKEHECEGKQRLIALMKIAIADGSWSTLTEENPGVYPATVDGWKIQIKSYEATVEAAMVDIREMIKHLKKMGGEAERLNL
jgi:hypothetical protein